MSENLVRAKADYVVCVCNTAHNFEPWILKGLGDVPFISLIELTSNMVLNRVKARGAPMKGGILGTSGCVKAALYQKALAKRGIEPILPS